MSRGRPGALQSASSGASIRMPPFSARDLTSLPNLLSLVRVPLGLVFAAVSDSQVAALGVIALAGITDMLDGWLARHSHHATAIGAVVDPICDKVFAFAVLITLIADGRIPVWGIVALSTREILQVPLVLWIGLSSRFRGARLAGARSNIPGKLATAVQFAAVLSAIVYPAALAPTLGAAAVAGVASGISYWIRHLRRRARGGLSAA
ncbi:MAG TPA: CDP-alcohol phosphatidyltransferase family protein [Bacilli bacterium]|jgi:CDP-diacylglycerol--glycerol-3-phosphate 3-phosphatidyltransferase/cardiolipin synthase|nr:CDP-alcohol phosphatidyltransferase family protein [Bacilli bacterium]